MAPDIFDTVSEQSQAKSLPATTQQPKADIFDQVEGQGGGIDTKTGTSIIDVTPGSGDMSVAEKLDNPYFQIDTPEKLRAEMAKSNIVDTRKISYTPTGFQENMPATDVKGFAKNLAQDVVTAPLMPVRAAAHLLNAPDTGAAAMQMAKGAVTGPLGFVPYLSEMATGKTASENWRTNPGIGAMTALGAGALAKGGATSALGRVGMEGNPELAALSQEHNVPLTLGEQTGSATAKGLETQLERVPFVGTRGFRQGQSAALGDAANRLVDKFTPDNPVDVPDQIQESMLKTLKQGKSDVGNIQNQIQEAVKTQNVEPIKPKNLRDAATNLLTEFPDIFERLPSTPLKSKLNTIIKGTDLEQPQSNVSNVLPEPKGIPFNEAMRLREMLNNYIDRAYNSAGAVGSKETYQLSSLKRALDSDLTDWGENSSNSNIVDLFKERNKMYQEKVAPFKDVIVKKATGNSFDTDLLYNQFIKSDRPQLAQKLMNALDPEGQQLVKYTVLKKALEAGQDTKGGTIFSPAKFAQVIERLGATKSTIFPGEEGTMIDGFSKLARAAERAGQYAENPPTGLRASDTGISIGIGGGMVTHPVGTLGALGAVKTLSSMLTSPWGKSLLMKAAKTPANSPAMDLLLTQFNQGQKGK